LLVEKIPVTITCETSTGQLAPDEEIIVSGSISPPLKKVVSLIFTEPDGTLNDKSFWSNPDGTYSYDYTPSLEGSWSVKVSIDGDEYHKGATSSSASFTVASAKKKSGCLIATATYDSELSPEVQFLRGFRDNTVLNTFAGSQFMNVFNQFYYSFSPSVASVITDNSVLRDIMKIVLYPLIGILHVSSLVFSVFSFLPELGIVISGVVASSLIGLVYFLPVVLLLNYFMKFNVSAKKVRIFALVWVGSIISLVLGEISKSPLIMMTSTGVFVLATMCVTILTLIRTMTTRYYHKTQ
jgi:hypothetical protein